MTRSSPPLEHSRGFTLVELMVTIAILSILLGIALPDFRQMLASERVRSANSDMFGALLLARSEAIKRNSTVDIVPTTTDWAGGWMVKVGTNVIQTRDALNAGVAVVQKDSSNATLASAATVSFGGNGRPTPASSDITFIFYSSAVSAVTARCTSLSLSGLPETKRDTDGNPANGCQ